MNIEPPDQGAIDPGRPHRDDLAFKLTDDDQLVDIAGRRPAFNYIAAPVNCREPRAGDYEPHEAALESSQINRLNNSACLNESRP